MEQNTTQKRKRVKLECLLCEKSFHNRFFDDDYKRIHDKKYHSQLITQGKSIPVQAVGAPENPFVAAAQAAKKRTPISSTSTITNPQQAKEVHIC